MKNINIHIYPSNMVNESRIFKESKFISKNCNFEKIVLLGIWREGLNKDELYENNIYIKRISLFNINKRSILYIYYFIYVFIFIIRNRPKMINIHTLEFLPLSLVAKIFKIKIIYDTHEFETEKGHVAGFRKKISKIIEKAFIRFVDKVIVVGEAIADEYKKMYPKMDRPFVVLNTPNYKVIENKDLFREKFNIDKKKMIFLYQGGLSRNRGIEILLEAFKILNNDKAVIIFMGFGPLENLIKESSIKFDNIYFHEAVSPNVLLEYTCSADFGILFYENTCLNHYYCSPNKIFEYIMAEIPVISSNLFEIKRIVEINEIGIVSKENTLQGMKKAIVEALESDKFKLRSNIQKTKLFLNWEEQEKILKKVYEGII